MGVVIKKKPGTKGELIAKKSAKESFLTHQSTAQKSNPKKQPFVIHSYAMSEDTEETLEHLKQEATDTIGRPISSSALLRALVHYLGQQSSSWTAKTLHPLIEKEIEAGRVWGTKGKKGG